MLPLALLVLGFLCQWMAWRVRLPAILFLLLTGIVLGPATGLFDPDALFGDLLFPLVSLGVAVILFEGSLGLRWSELRGVAPAVFNLVSFGALISVGVLAAAAHYLVGLSWELALLFGALTCVTGPTVVSPMLRAVRPNARIANVLRWEGIVIDPIGALFAVLVFAWISLGLEADTFGSALAAFGWTTAVGTGFGVIGAILLGGLLRRQWIPEYLQNYAALVMVLSVFSLSNMVSHESGLLAVTIMGMWLGNRADLHMDDILDFKEHLSTLLISLLFIVLAARLEWPSLELALGGLTLLGVAVLVARPLSVMFSTLGSSLNWRERALIGWIAPRGIVAAAVSALFALKLEDAGVPGAEQIVPLTFMLIIGTVVLQSATSRKLAAMLGVSEPDSRGVLIVGAGRVSRALARALHQHKFEVLVADDDWMAIRAARMDGLRTYFGNPVSEHADVHLDLTGIGTLIAISARREINTLACVRFEPEFGKEHIFRLRILAPGEAPKQSISGALRGRPLFGEGVTQRMVEEMLDNGAAIKSTKLSENFGWKDYREKHGQAAMLLFAIDERGFLRPAHETREWQPKAGWTVITLIPKAAPVAEPSAAPGDYGEPAPLPDADGPTPSPGSA
nr:sodium:proton antiporter [Lysobacter sp. CAU 1642]